MAQRLHLEFGGELIDPTETVFKNVNELHIAGIFPDCVTAYAALMAEAKGLRQCPYALFYRPYALFAQ